MISGIKIYFNAFDALVGWKREPLPPVEVPVLPSGNLEDYDYTFTTPYSGSQIVEVILYEDELADNGVSLLTVKSLRVMPTWFLLLRFWLRVDDVLMRLRDARVVCTFGENAKPVILRDVSWRETTFKSLASKGYPSDAASYNDPNAISQRLPVMLHKTQKLKIPDVTNF
ncbi:hypothetical protein R6Q57_029433 [Mikania cordata]